MSFDAVTWAIQQPLRDAKEKMLLVVLAHHLNSKTGRCCPSRETLMTMACVANSNTLTAKINALVEKGLIEVVRGNGASNSYKFLTTFTTEAPSELKHLQDCTTFTAEAPTTFTTEAPPPSVLKHEQGKNKELNKDIRTASVPASIPQTESSTEIGTGTENGTTSKKAEKKPKTSVAVSRPEEVTKESWDAWMQVRKSKRAPQLNSIAWSRFQNEAQKAGLTLQQAVTICAAREWRGFEAEWIKSSNSGSSFGSAAPTQTSGGSLFGSFSK